MESNLAWKIDKARGYGLVRQLVVLSAMDRYLFVMLQIKSLLNVVKIGSTIIRIIRSTSFVFEFLINFSASTMQ